MSAVFIAIWARRINPETTLTRPCGCTSCLETKPAKPLRSGASRTHITSEKSRKSLWNIPTRLWRYGIYFRTRRRKLSSDQISAANTLLPANGKRRSEEHTSELQSHSFISYAVFCLKKKNK